MNRFHGLIIHAKKSHAIRYLVVGTLNTAFSYLIYAICLYIGFRFQFANLFALILGIIFSFKTQGRLVFQNPSNRLFGRYVISWVVIYLASILLIGQIINLGINAYWAGVFALPFSVSLSYLAQKYFVFYRS